MVTITPINGLPLRMGFLLSQSLYGTVVDHSPTSVSFDMTGTWPDASGMVNRFNGYGLAYDEASERFEGTVTSYEHLVNGVVDFRLSNLNFAASDLVSLTSNNRLVDPVGHRFFGGDDNITGSNEQDAILGYAGNDTIYAGGGDDYINAEYPSMYPRDVPGTTGNGHDVVHGGAGSDSIFGGGGNDHLYGFGPTAGIDGNDTIEGDLGSDYIQGNAGDDLLIGGEGSDRMQGGADNDVMYGGKGNDSLNGNRGDDSIDSGLGNDFIRGGQGDDTILASDGDDTVLGDLGADYLDGGAGSDTFVFGLSTSSIVSDIADADTIVDFLLRNDRISVGFTPQYVFNATQTSTLPSTVEEALFIAQRLFDERLGNHEIAVVKTSSICRIIFWDSDENHLIDSMVGVLKLSNDDGSADMNFYASDFI